MTPIVKKSLSEQIYEDLRHRILAQEITFGEKLTNRDLQAHYGVSSTPVRDAVNFLHRDGLVEYPTRTGARVITFDLKHALDINEVLSILGVSAIRLSAQRAKRAEVASRLESILDKQESNIGNDSYYDYDQEFHSTFFEHSGNEQLRSIYTQYHMLHEMLVRCYHRVQDTRDLAVKEHRRIYEAYSKGDFELACKYMREHYKAAEAILGAVLK